MQFSRYCSTCFLFLDPCEAWSLVTQSYNWSFCSNTSLVFFKSWQCANAQTFVYQSKWRNFLKPTSMLWCHSPMMLFLWTERIVYVPYWASSHHRTTHDHGDFLPSATAIFFRVSIDDYTWCILVLATWHFSTHGW